MAETFEKYDIAQDLETPQDVVAYLNETLAYPDDTELLMQVIGDIARSKGMSEIAEQTGLNREHLYRALSAKGNPSFATIVKVLGSCGLRLHAVPA